MMFIIPLYSYNAVSPLAMHQTIVEIFGREYALAHPDACRLKRILPDDIVLLTLGYLNPKPGNVVPIPKEVFLDLEIYDEMYDKEKQAFRLMVWYDVYVQTCGGDDDPEVGNIYAPVKMSFGHAEFIPGECEVKYEKVGWCSDVQLDCFGNMDAVHDNTKYRYGIWFSKEAPVYKGGEPVAIYLDPCRKQPVEIGDDENRYDPDKVKRIYVDYSNYYEFQTYRIYMPVFAHLLKIGKSIEDLNYATEIEFNPLSAEELGCNGEYYDDAWPYGVTNLDQWRIKITFGEEKLRDLKYEDYENNVILYEYNTDLSEYVPDTIGEKGWTVHKDWYSSGRRDRYPRRYWWSGIPYKYTGCMVMGNFCDHIGFNTEERCFGMGGECG
jgi:hypothetical protein